MHSGPAARILFVLLSGGVAIAALLWLCRHDPAINFLPGDARAHWIVFPAAFDSRSHQIANLDTTFRRRFVLERAPGSARLRVRAARRLELRVNNTLVEVVAPRNWKEMVDVDLGRFIRGGENVIEARVFNHDAPPLLWLVLNAGEVTIRSDNDWEASCAGSAWRAATRADAARTIGAGNAVAGGETTIRSLRRVWPIWATFAAMAVIFLLAIGRRFSTALRERAVVIAIVVAGVSWAALGFNNARLLPHLVGFDAKEHLNYIKYIQERRALPPPNEGLEMFQPPLYYTLSAGVLAAARASADEASGIIILRTMSILCGLAHAVFVLLSLRLLWPGNVSAQLAGFALAAFLPMQFYMAHYVTNETLVAMLTSLAVYLALRLSTRNVARTRDFIALGLVMGAALLTKLTAVVVIPFIVAALAWHCWKRGARAMELALNVGALIAIPLLLAGWHYLRISGQMSGELVGGPGSGFLFWQDEGYRIAGYFTRFGRALAEPFFSVTASFGDGLYSTLWGDGLWGGTGTMNVRPPWNYDLMSAGYLLSLCPTLLIIIGVVSTVASWGRHGARELFILIGLSAGMMAALVYLNLSVPRYASVKTFYALSALVALAYFGASGWDLLTRSHPLARWTVGILLMVWALNSYTSFWIRPNASYHVYNALLLASDKKRDAAALAAREAIRLDPSHWRARQFLAAIEELLGHSVAAREQAEQAVALNPSDSFVHLQLAVVLANHNEDARVIAASRRAIELGPENVPAYDLLVTVLRHSVLYREAIEAAEAGLAVAPSSAELHYKLALAMADERQLVGAANHFAYALMLQPKSKQLRMKLVETINDISRMYDPAARFAEAEATAPDCAEMREALAAVRSRVKQP